MALPNLSTSDARIAYVAYHYNTQYPDHHAARCAALGINEDEIDAGFALGRELRDERRGNYAYYGDPAYGSWPANAVHPILDRVLKMMEETAEVSQ